MTQRTFRGAGLSDRSGEDYESPFVHESLVNGSEDAGTDAVRTADDRPRSRRPSASAGCGCTGKASSRFEQAPLPGATPAVLDALAQAHRALGQVLTQLAATRDGAGTALGAEREIDDEGDDVEPSDELDEAGDDIELDDEVDDAGDDIELDDEADLNDGDELDEFAEFEASSILPKEKVRWAQAVLNHVEGERLAVDGDFGKLSKAAVQRFQQARGLSPTGALDQATEIALLQRGIERLERQSLYPAYGTLTPELMQHISVLRQRQGASGTPLLDADTRSAMRRALDTLQSTTTPPSPSLPGGAAGGTTRAIIEGTIQRVLHAFQNVSVSGNSAGRHQTWSVHVPYFNNDESSEANIYADRERGAVLAVPGLKALYDGLPERVRVRGKPTSGQVRAFLQDALDGNLVPRQASGIESKDLKEFLRKLGIGVDCSGFVSHALSACAEKLGLVDASILASSINLRAGGKKAPFDRVERPRDLLPGDTMWNQGHIRIVHRVRPLPDGTLEMVTAESTSGSEGYGPKSNTWKFADPELFDSLEKPKHRYVYSRYKPLATAYAKGGTTALPPTPPAAGTTTSDASSAQPTRCEQEVVSLVLSSPLMRYHWPGRRVAYAGYLKGMGLTFARVYCKFKASDPSALLMASADSGNASIDALTVYRKEFRALAMDNSVSGPDTLRHLFVLLIGLGMRESSGRYCEPKDASSKDNEPRNAPSGAFQISYSSGVGSQDKTFAPLRNLYNQLKTLPYSGYRHVFEEGVPCKSWELSNFGTGAVGQFREFCVMQPALCAELVAVGLRMRRKHWGPINELTVELNADCDALLARIQAAVDSGLCCSHFVPNAALESSR
jgi:peptidoglycan hydrolase-like protein with peptidoglycan-binding domain